MSLRVTLGRSYTLTLGTTVTELIPVAANQDDPAIPGPRQILFYEAAVDVSIVTARTATDGGAVPAGSPEIPAATMAGLPTYPLVDGYHFLGLAGSGAGDVTFELR